MLETGIQALPTMIKPNQDEIKMLTGKACGSLADIMEAAGKLHKTGIEIVAVSLGGDGCVVACKEGIYRATVPKIDAVNTVGCGDAMIAGFALGLAENASPEELLRKASAISAASAMHEKTGVFRMEDMEHILPQVKIVKEKAW
jgi:tagatose 6-phosphate kinase